MKSGNKKTNRLSDISRLIPAHSELYWQKLQQSRLFRFVPEKKLVSRAPRTAMEKKDVFAGLLDSVPQLLAKQAELKPDLELIPRKLKSSRKKIAHSTYVKFKSARSIFYNLTKRFVGNSAPKLTRRSFFSQPQLISSLAGFLAIAMLVLSVFPALRALQRDFQARADVLGAATSAYEQLASVQGYLLNSDFEGAGSLLSQAYSGFIQAATTFEQLSTAARLSSQVPEAEKLLYGAREAVLGLQYLNSALGQISAIRLSETGFSGGGDESLVEVLHDVELDFMSAKVYLKSALAYIRSVDRTKIPEEIGKKVQATEGMLASLISGGELLFGFQKILSAFVEPEEKNYLLLFQNHRELRATGGFIGTIGLLRQKEGRFEELKIESVYNPDGQLKEHIAPPGPLQRTLTNKWGLRDSNWFFNFPDSAVKASEFYEKETGIKIDGVVAMTPEIFIKLLQLTGPIEVPSYGEKLTAENFLDVVQYQTSVVYDRKLNQPKKFLADFAPLLLERIRELPTEQRLSLFELFITSLAHKDIMVFSSDVGLQTQLSSAGWGGDVRTTDADYLAVVHSNVGAGKTDRNISQDISLNVDITDDGEALHTLRIKRIHQPGNEKEFPTNVDFIRVYVPLGSKLISALGFDGQRYWPSEIEGGLKDQLLSQIDQSTMIDALSGTLISEEAGKTVFGNWIILPPGQERDLVLVYRTPLKYNPLDREAEAYRLLTQRQAGAGLTSLTATVGIPEGSRTEWLRPGTVVENSKIIYKGDLTRDFGWGFVFN